MSDPAQDAPPHAPSEMELAQSVQVLVRRLSSVRSVGVAVEDQGQLQQIRLMADATVEPRHLAREVASLVTNWLNVDVTPDMVEVIQLWDEDAHSRLRILSYEEIPSGPQVEVRVRLAAGSLVVEGKAVGPGLPQMRPRVAAAAAVDGLNHRFQNPGLCTVGTTDLVHQGQEQVVLALTYLRGQPYSGSSLVRGGQVGEAAVRAVLTSLNRQLTWPQQR